MLNINSCELTEFVIDKINISVVYSWLIGIQQSFYFLAEKLKSQITQGLLDMTKSLQWSKRLSDLGVSGFTAIDSNLYTLETEMRSAVGKLTMVSTYY